jgi:NAD(P)-dependent dehydrogenase (short-subunit alcohol dehydrogenase family)
MSTPVVLITGALTGIGHATAIAFAKEGVRLVVSGRKEAEGKVLEAMPRGLGAEAEFVLADVRHEKDVSSLIDTAVARFGRLDVAAGKPGPIGRPEAGAVSPNESPGTSPPGRPLRQREAERDEGRGVVDQALALQHNQDPANVSAIATWRNCFGYVASVERY